MVAAMAGGRPSVDAELLVGPTGSCCCSWCEDLAKGLVVPELGVGWRGSGGGEIVVLEGGNTGTVSGLSRGRDLGVHLYLKQIA